MVGGYTQAKDLEEGTPETQAEGRCCLHRQIPIFLGHCIEHKRRSSWLKLSQNQVRFEWAFDDVADRDFPPWTKAPTRRQEVRRALDVAHHCCGSDWSEGLLASSST